jgi:ethanolamine ammonia-lyase large subunit
MSDTTDALFIMSLEASVTLAILDLKKRSGLDAISDWQLEQVRSYCDQLGAEGDTLLFPVKGKTAENFARLSEALAIMAFFPGGVKIAGLHFEVKEVSDGVVPV